MMKLFHYAVGTLFFLTSGLALAGERPANIPEGMGVLPTTVPIPADNPMSAAKTEPVSYKHIRAHETKANIVCSLQL